jgi:hypothetical protein
VSGLHVRTTRATSPLRDRLASRAPGDLHVQQRSGLEPMLPVDREAEELHVELAGLALVEDPQNRRRSAAGSRAT